MKKKSLPDTIFKTSLMQYKFITIKQTNLKVQRYTEIN